MSLILRLFGAMLGLLMLAITVYIGILSQEDNRFIVWFGLSAAISAPLGLKLLGYAIRSHDTLVNRLAKVPEIHTLIEQAGTHEERVKLLTQEYARLEEIVRIESRRQALADRVNSLERDASRILGELDELDREALALDQEVGESAATEEIRHLRERIDARRRGDAVLSFGRRQYRIDQDIIRGLPFGNFLLAHFVFAEWVRKAWITRTNRTNGGN